MKRRTLVFIYGPPAVGKMTVGMELAKQTGLKLFHNHQTIDLLTPFFKFGTPAYLRCINIFRFTIFREVARSPLPGLIFTLVRVYGKGPGNDDAWVNRASQTFLRQGGRVIHVELFATQKERLKRNRTPLRLREKPSKRNLRRSDKNLLALDQQFPGRMNTEPGVMILKNYLRIDNTHMTARSAARLIKRRFGL